MVPRNTLLYPLPLSYSLWGGSVLSADSSTIWQFSDCSRIPLMPVRWWWWWLDRLSGRYACLFFVVGFSMFPVDAWSHGAFFSWSLLHLCFFSFFEDSSLALLLLCVVNQWKIGGCSMVSRFFSPIVGRFRILIDYYEYYSVLFCRCRRAFMWWSGHFFRRCLWVLLC